MKSLLSTLLLTTVMLVILFSGHPSYAKNLGVVGQTYSILEEDFLTFIETRYQTMKANGEWEKVQTAWQKKMVAYADRPKPVDAVTTAQSHRVYYVDPSIELSHDIIGLHGEIIAKAGTLINPLEIMPLHKTLLFLNADDPSQFLWAIKKDKEFQGRTKWILVKGSIAETIKKINKPVYFDQAGKLTSHFNIKHVPALVKQEGMKLRITEERL